MVKQVDVIVKSLWCIRCYGDKKIYVSAPFMYNGNSLCEDCVKFVENLEHSGKNVQWGYSLGQ